MMKKNPCYHGSKGASVKNTAVEGKCEAFATQGGYKRPPTCLRATHLNKMHAQSHSDGQQSTLMEIIYQRDMSLKVVMEDMRRV